MDIGLSLTLSPSGLGRHQEHNHLLSSHLRHCLHTFVVSLIGQSISGIYMCQNLKSFSYDDPLGHHPLLLYSFLGLPQFFVPPTDTLKLPSLGFSYRHFTDTIYGHFTDTYRHFTEIIIKVSVTHRHFTDTSPDTTPRLKCPCLKCP